MSAGSTTIDSPSPTNVTLKGFTAASIWASWMYGFLPAISLVGSQSDLYRTKLVLILRGGLHDPTATLWMTRENRSPAVKVIRFLRKLPCTDDFRRATMIP